MDYSSHFMEMPDNQSWPDYAPWSSRFDKVLVMAFSNLQRVLDQLRRFGQDWYDGAAAAQVDAAEEVLERAKLYTPVDTGYLKQTGRVEIELRELPLASAQIIFDAPYAAVVHERLDLNHAPPTQAKFLERAVRELSNEMTLKIGQGAVRAARRRLR
jgi:hypothetical protein